MKKWRVNQFPPPQFKAKNSEGINLKNLIGKEYRYAVNGRSAIYHLLKSHKIGDGDRVALPAYICETVIIPLKMLNIEPIFCDVDREDLNISIKDFKLKAEKLQIKAVIVPSLYGNPANLIEFENYCKENDIIMIDDGAQSFFSKIENRYVSTFGNGGLFSFSPGKATAGHLGAYFWTEEENYFIDRTRHRFIHYLAWVDFYFNRMQQIKMTKWIYYVKLFFNKLIPIQDDQIENFEENILNAILNGVVSGGFDFRKKYWEEFKKENINSKDFVIVEAIRGKAYPHKIVLRFTNAETRNIYYEKLMRNGIYVSKGYAVIDGDSLKLGNYREIYDKILELPIINDANKMGVIFAQMKKE